MASIIPGYEYDIFISYRQKDNKGDKWVSEFVEALKAELESTFKEEISVYFDINPHDGLLETHDVNASLKDKLKCLVFIPIISRTYCDPKSFAWEREFKAFVEQASKDQFGLKIKLPKGNVSSRVLPIRIHDIDIADIRLCEDNLGDVLRGIEFVYEEPGVNRPLTPGDDENKNLKKTRYRNQVNKVALAINEIVQGLMTEPEWQKFEKRVGEEEFRQAEVLIENEGHIERKVPESKSWLKLIFGTIILAVLIAVIAYPGLFKRETLEKLRSSGERISVAVMPFQNMTTDSIWNVWQNGIQNELITYLTNSQELKIRQTESINKLIQGKGFTNYASITPSIASTLSQKLDANVFVFGSIKQAGEKIRVNAQLIDSKTEEIFKSFQVEGKTDNILDITDNLSKKIKDFLILSVLKKEVESDVQPLIGSTSSPEACKYALLGHEAFIKEDYSKAQEYYLQALKIDSTDLGVIIYLSWAYNNQGNPEEGKKYCLKAYGKRDQMSEFLKINMDYLYANYFKTPREMIASLKQFIELDEQAALYYEELGWNYDRIEEYDKTILAMEKGLEVYKKWGTKPFFVWSYIYLGIAYHKTGQFEREKELYKKALKDFPDDFQIISLQAILALTEKDSAKANTYINRYQSLLKGELAPEADIANGIAEIYSEAGNLDKAEEYLRKALLLEPGVIEKGNKLAYYLYKMGDLAYFLIDKNRNVSEGLEIVEKKLKSSPENYDYLHTKGWGLYKQGKYQEALEILQKSWDLRMKKAVYDYDAAKHLQTAKKAVAEMKNY
ncbi:MAG: tetratricopeptide repeat protein [Bacteroidales bacterium]